MADRILAKIKFLGPVPPRKDRLTGKPVTQDGKPVPGGESITVKSEGTILTFKTGDVKEISISKAEHLVATKPGLFQITGTNVIDPEKEALKAELTELKKKK